MSFIEYALGKTTDSSTLEAMITNYTNLNATHMSKNVLKKEINALTSKIASCTDSSIKVCLESYENSLQKELTERLTGSKIYDDICYENIVADADLSDNNLAIFESVDIYPNTFEDDVQRLDNLLESYNKTFDKAGMLIVSIMPKVFDIAKKDDSVLTESLCHVMYDIADKITQENECANMVEYTHIIKESYNDLYYSWDKNKDSNTYKLLSSASQLYKELNVYMESALKDVNNINHENIILGKITESYYKLADENEENEIQLMENVIQFGRYLELLEAYTKQGGAKSAKWKLNQKIEKKTREMGLKNRGKYDTEKRNKAPLEKSKENLVKMINYPINQIIAKDKEERRTRLIEGRIRAKIWKAIKSAINGGILYLVGGPVFAVIGLITGIAIDKSLDHTVRQQILHEMEAEMKIIEEKISDAKSSGDRKEKYQLMRLQSTLEKDIDRVRYGLKGKY